MSQPDPNCSNCEGRGWMPAIGLDLHEDGKHDCFCVTHDQGPKHPEDMTREEVNAEILEWREGKLYRGYDRLKALEVPKLKAKIDALETALKSAEDSEELKELRRFSAPWIFLFGFNAGIFVTLALLSFIIWWGR